MHFWVLKRPAYKLSFMLKFNSLLKLKLQIMPVPSQAAQAQDVNKLFNSDIVT